MTTFTAITTYNMVFDGVRCGHRHQTPEAAETCGNKNRPEGAALVIEASTGRTIVLYPGKTLPPTVAEDWEPMPRIPLTPEEQAELDACIIG